jgi:hypothetical protein
MKNGLESPVPERQKKVGRLMAIRRNWVDAIRVEMERASGSALKKRFVFP